MDPSDDTQATDATVHSAKSTSADPLERSGPIGRGETIGPYLVLEALAEGGMGIVYSAYHPGLNRKAALKLIRPDVYGGVFATAGKARLLREAQAMAQLSHPNVVTVFDAGTVGDKVFIAMELVEGSTLKHWLLTSKRSWREVVSLFIEAGRGLAAAHRVGLIHRDFKPDNVLVGADGRPRVTDFGLARALDATAEQATTRVPAPTTPILQTPMTIAGSVMGTPGFLPPEQGRGSAVDARSDQFSFFASLHFGLYGALPFEGPTLEETLVRMEKGDVRPAPAHTDVPGRIRAVVLRGLAARPDGRFPSLDAGLEALRRAARPVYRRAWPAFAGLAVLALAAGVAAIAQQRRARCTGFERELSSIWDAPSKAALKTALEQTGLSYATDAWVGVERTVDAYTRDWVVARSQVCQAIERNPGAEPRLTQRCLEDRRDELSAATTGLKDRLMHGDKDSTRTAVQAVASLTPLSRCNDPRAMLALGDERSPEAAEERVALRKRLAQVKALLDARQHKQAEQVATALVADARSAGGGAFLAEALFNLGEVQRRRSLWKPALQTLEEADLVADANGFDWLRARIAATAATTHNLSQNNDAARVWLKRAHARIDRLGGEPWSEIRTSTTEGAVAFVDGKRDVMLASIQHGLEVARAAYGENHPQTGSMLMSLGIAFHNFERFEDSLRTANETMDVYRRVFGPNHPDVSEGAKLAGAALAHLGDFEQGRRLLEASIGPLTEAWGPEDFRVAEAHATLAVAFRGLGDLDQALEHSQRAQEIFAKTFGPKSDAVVEVLAQRAELFRNKGEPKAAWAAVTSALAISGNRKDLLGEPLLSRGRLELDEKKFKEAAASFQHGLDALGHGASADTQDAADLRAGLGEALLGLRRPADAVMVLETALAYRSGKRLPKADTARVELALGRALWDAETDRPRAVQLVRSARQDSSGAPAWAQPSVAQADAWLKAHAE